jgi:hypothetical protein
MEEPCIVYIKVTLLELQGIGDMLQAQPGGLAALLPQAAACEEQPSSLAQCMGGYRPDEVG